MTSAEPALDELQREALTELMNISFGASVSALSSMVGTFIELGVPSVEDASIDDLRKLMQKAPDQNSDPFLVRQEFFPTLRGEAWLLFQSGVEEIALEFGLKPEHGGEIVLEMTNILVGTCLGKLSELLGTETSFSPPKMHEAGEVRFALADGSASAQDLAVVLVRVPFRRDFNNFTGFIALVVSRQNVGTLRDAVDAWVQSVMCG